MTVLAKTKQQNTKKTYKMKYSVEELLQTLFECETPRHERKGNMMPRIK